MQLVPLTCLPAPRAGLEPAAYCLGGTIRAWPDEAGHGLMRYYLRRQSLDEAGCGLMPAVAGSPFGSPKSR